ncbi:hypothetical protein FRB94_008370 [Tulasnella sp. JGI-2019a]|nr:hypothetical protein FRB94_008370 [Tulasnella sp. JGI-2019a]
MESALSIPEVLDEILQQATSSAQAASAQTCQLWSSHSLKWLWRHMPTFYPTLELLSPLEMRSGAWEFKSDLSHVDWKRFSQYTGYIHSIDYNQSRVFRHRRSLPSRGIFAEILLYRPASDGSMFPNLTEVNWASNDGKGLLILLLFLVPSLTCLQITCNGSTEDACSKVLSVLEPRGIRLSELWMGLRTPSQAFLDRLAPVIASQKDLIRVGLPPYTATREVVKALGQLPLLEDYESWGFAEYQAPLQLGMDFEWEDGSFSSLKTLAFSTSLAVATEIMTSIHQPRLHQLSFETRELCQHPQLRDLCSSISNAQSSITTLNLELFAEAVSPGPTRAIPFDAIRPLLQCAALTQLRVESDLAMEYGDEDIATMASAWPNLQRLALCADPTSRVGLAIGQPLQSVSKFVQSFCVLEQLSLYIKALTVDVIHEVSSDVREPRLNVLDFGTSPLPIDSSTPIVLAASLYLSMVLEPQGEIKSGRSISHTRCLQASMSTTEEYFRRSAFWTAIATNIEMIRASTRRLMEENDILLRRNRELQEELEKMRGQGSCKES